MGVPLGLVRLLWGRGARALREMKQQRCMGGASTALLHGAVIRPHPSVASITAGSVARSNGAKAWVLLRKVIFVVLVLGPAALLDSNAHFART